MDDFERHIDHLPIGIQPIYRELRKVAKSGLPHAIEMLYHNSFGYSLTASPWDRICYIAHQPKGYVNFGFFFGAGLPDPTGLIEGKGKRLRHVKVRSLDDARNAELKKLVALAWKKAETDISGWRESLRKKPKVIEPRTSRDGAVSSAVRAASSSDRGLGLDARGNQRPSGRTP
jgi:hypothetical protein